MKTSRWEGTAASRRSGHLSRGTGLSLCQRLQPNALALTWFAYRFHSTRRVRGFFLLRELWCAHHNPPRPLHFLDRKTKGKIEKYFANFYFPFLRCRGWNPGHGHARRAFYHSLTLLAHFMDFFYWFFSKGFMEDFNSFKSNMPIKEWLEYFIYLFKFLYNYSTPTAGKTGL